MHTVELMPVATFPGQHGWGYDGINLWAVHEPYGGPDGLKRFVDACHARGLAVMLDVVYNHVGIGNRLAAFGPYFTEAHVTPWGPAVNLDQPGSDEVRAFLIGNALMWLRDYHLDGLRLDAETMESLVIHDGQRDGEGVWESSGIKMDFDQRRAFVRGEEVHLRRKEFELLRLLVENAGRVLTRDVLIDRVWGTDYIGDTKTLDVHVKRLRSRIEADPSVPVLITTVRGVGYRFASIEP